MVALSVNVLTLFLHNSGSGSVSGQREREGRRRRKMQYLISPAGRFRHRLLLFDSIFASVQLSARLSRSPSWIPCFHQHQHQQQHSSHRWQSLSTATVCESGFRLSGHGLARQEQISGLSWGCSTRGELDGGRGKEGVHSVPYSTVLVVSCSLC